MAMERILAWEPFQRSERLSRFLRYAVEQVLEQDTPQLKEYVIALEVFDKPKEFDPRLDPIVRVEARRLRTRIREYYEIEGRHDAVRIRFGPRGYKPTFEALAQQTSSKPPSSAGTLHEEAAPAKLAVLPFVDLNPNGGQQDLSESLTEELINALGRFGGLRVASRTSTRRFAGKSFDIRRAGRELGVTAILEGSIRRDETRIRIAAQLCSVSDGLELWSRAYERSSEDSFALVTEIAATIAESLNIRLANGRRSADGIGPPAHARAAALGLANAILAWFHEARPAESWPKAEAAAAAALSLDPFLSAAHTLDGCYKSLFLWDWPAAERAFLRAIEIGHDEASAYEWYARALLVPMRRFDEALQSIERAQAVEPLSPMIQSHAGTIRFYRGETEEARELFQRALEVDSAFWPALWNLGRVLLAEEDHAKAEEALLRARDAAQGIFVMEGHLGYCYARQGKREIAESVAAELQQRARSRYVSPLQWARIHIGLEQYGEAVAAIEAAMQHRCARLVELAADPLYRPLRDNPRFQSVIRAIGLPF